MVRHRQRCLMPFLEHDFLPSHFPTKGPKRVHDFPAANRGQLGHQALTSTKQVSTVKGIPRSARTSRQRRMASRMFLIASAFVLPWLMHPGMDGHSVIQTPSSSRSTVTGNFMGTPSKQWRRLTQRGPKLFPWPDEFNPEAIMPEVRNPAPGNL